MSPGRVLAEHSSQDLSEWMAFDRGIGSLDPDADRRAALICSHVWNANGGIPEGKGPQAGTRAATIEDFLPGRRAEADDEDVDGTTERRIPRTHDDTGDDTQAHETTEADRLKYAFAMFAGPINAKIREQSKKVDPGDPPDDPDAN